MTTLSDWLQTVPRDPNPYQKFRLADVNECAACSDEMKVYLADRLFEARHNLDVVHDLAARLGWNNVKRLLEQTLPTRVNMKRGTFGEVLAADLLKHFEGYDIPVAKMRFTIRANDSQTGTDILALKVDGDGRVSEVCYGESKLRTNADTAAPLSGARQLEADYNVRTPDILMFVANRLRETAHPLYEPFVAYISDRRDLRDIDRHRLVLVWERSAWTDGALQNMEDSNLDLPNLSVDVVLASDLAGLTNDVFERIGAATEDDGD